MLENVLDEDLRKNLEGVPPDKTRVVIIRPKTSEEYDRFLSEALKTRPSREIKDKLIQYKIANAAPIVGYLKKIGVRANTLDMLGIVVAELNRDQIYGLAREPYVVSISPDSKTELIE